MALLKAFQMATAQNGTHASN